MHKDGSSRSHPHPLKNVMIVIFVFIYFSSLGFLFLVFIVWKLYSLFRFLDILKTLVYKFVASTYLNVRWICSTSPQAFYLFIYFFNSAGVL